MINATIVKFGYPATLVVEGRHWVVLLRPAAPTLGALVLAAKGEATAYGDLPVAAFVEQAEIVARIEGALARFVEYEKINYLMLMMNDAHVHFHIVPRYAGSRSYDSIEFPDAGWPGMPMLSAARDVKSATASRIIERLRECGLSERKTDL